MYGSRSYVRTEQRLVQNLDDGIIGFVIAHVGSVAAAFFSIQRRYARRLKVRHAQNRNGDCLWIGSGLRLPYPIGGDTHFLARGKFIYCCQILLLLIVPEHVALKE